MTAAIKFKELFSGREDAYGIYKPGCYPEYETIKKPLTLDHYKKHLAGELSLGVIPITKDNKCSVGIIDDDFQHQNKTYDYKKLLRKISLLELPVTVFKSKTNGAHIVIYFDGYYPAVDVRHILKKLAYQLCEGKYDLFPRQDEVPADSYGSFINLPYHNQNTRVLLNSEGNELNFDDAMLYASKRVVKLDDLAVFKILADKEMTDSRNCRLFRAKQYFKTQYPKDFENKVRQLNKLYQEPITERELNATVLKKNAPDYFDIEKNKKDKKNPSAWREGSTAKEIYETNYPDIEWIVDGLIGPGLTFISGKSKIGKSFASLQIDFAVETGGTFLGCKCAKGKVLHYSLEDGKRRNKRRWQTMGISPNEALYQFRDRKTKIPLLTMGLEEEIEDWIAATPDAKMVIIDPYVKVKKTISGIKLNSYENDNFNLQNINTLANKYNIAVVFIHHTKKKAEDDVFDEMNGSAGIQSNCDSMIVLSTNRKMGSNTVLSCIPKDAEQKEFEIALSPKCLWEYVGKVGEANRTKLQKLILESIKSLDSGDGVQVAGIKSDVVAKDNSFTEAHVQTELGRLAEKGEVLKLKKGIYKLSNY